MRSKLARLGAVLLGVVGLFATMTAPASADTVGAVAFIGNANLGNALDYPCVPTATVPPTFTKQCPPTVTTTSKGGTLVPNVTITGGNTSGVVFAATACVGVAVNDPTKTKTPTAAAGMCGITAAGVTVTGFCGLSSGKGTANVTVTSLLGGTKTVTAGFSFVGIGGTLIITGGDPTPFGYALVGVAEAFTVPSTSLPSRTISNSCHNKTARTFTVVGAASILDLN